MYVGFVTWCGLDLFCGSPIRYFCLFAGLGLRHRLAYTAYSYPGSIRGSFRAMFVRRWRQALRHAHCGGDGILSVAGISIRLRTQHAAFAHCHYTCKPPPLEKRRISCCRKPTDRSSLSVYPVRSVLIFSRATAQANSNARRQRYLCDAARIFGQAGSASWRFGSLPFRTWTWRRTPALKTARFGRHLRVNTHCAYAFYATATPRAPLRPSCPFIVDV
jgi:hypothetical protein